MDREQILSEARAGGITSTLQLSEQLQIPRTTLRRMIQCEDAALDLELIYQENGKTSRPDRPEQTITRCANSSGETLEVRGVRITSLEDLLDEAEVDLSEWRVKDYSVNAWESGDNTNFSVKARLERIQEAVDLSMMRDAAIKAMREHSPAPVRRYKATPREGLAFEVNIPDLHLGKLAHAEETGENYDGKIAVDAYRHVLAELLTHAQNMNVGRIIFPVGNDLLHVDSATNETTGGTRQDVDTRWYRSVKRAIDLMVEAVDAMLQIAPVDMVIVPGNHARMQEQMLGEILVAWYRNEDRLTVHDTPAPRKYIQHGSTLLGFTHGDGVKAKDLPLIMAAEAPQEWAQTRFRSWSTGHLHQRKSERPGHTVLEEKGVEVRISPSLSGSDYWHTSKGFIKNLRAAEAYVHCKDNGEIARFRATLPENV
jgi:hypothetical protein